MVRGVQEMFKQKQAFAQLELVMAFYGRRRNFRVKVVTEDVWRDRIPEF